MRKDADYYSPLLRRYDEVESDCDHPNSEITLDERGVYRGHCPNCGMTGYCDEDGARKFGWID